MAKGPKLSQRENDKRKAEMKEARRQRKLAKRAERVAAGETTPRPKRSLLSSTDPEKMNKSNGPHLHKQIPPPALFDLMHDFLKDYKYIKAAHGLRTDNQKRPGHNLMLWKHKGEGYPSLLDIFIQWQKENPQSIPPPAKKEPEPVAANSDESSDSSDSDDDKMSVDGGAATIPTPVAPKNNLKRKASDSSSSSDDTSSSDEAENEIAATVSSSDSSSESDAEDSKAIENPPAAKKAKIEVTVAKATVAQSSSSSSEDDSDDSSGSPVKPPTAITISEPALVAAAAAAVPLPASSSESSSESSSSEDDSSDDEPTKNIVKPVVTTRDSSDSSATLPITETEVSKPSESSSDSESSSSSSSDESSDDEAPAPATVPVAKPKKQQELLVYNEPVSKTKRKRDPEAVGEQKIVPATVQNFKKLKKTHTPFSRIPADIKVDDKFASNKYISYDYADKAHQDLIVTKGKGFTKAKNKGKRGSYKGGAIDTMGVRAVKFDN